MIYQNHIGIKILKDLGNSKQKKTATIIPKLIWFYLELRLKQISFMHLAKSHYTII